MSCIITYKGNKYTQEQFKEYISGNKNEFSHIIASNKNVIDSFKRKMEGIDYVFSQSPELASVGSKVQYLQYLSTIFKTSKVKDIVYHGTDGEFENYIKTNSVNFDNFRHDAFYFTSDINDAKSGGTGNREVIRRRIINNLINLKKPLVLKVGKVYGDFERNILGLWDGENLIEDLSSKGFLNDIKKEDVNKYSKLGYDGIIIEEAERLGLKGKKNWQIIFEPEQIHILSSKKDLEMFKNFINFTKSEYAKYGDIQQLKDYIMSKNFAAIEEFLVVNNKIDRKC